VASGTYQANPPHGQLGAIHPESACSVLGPFSPFLARLAQVLRCVDRPGSIPEGDLGGLGQERAEGRQPGAVGAEHPVAIAQGTILNCRCPLVGRFVQCS
jgi:hypothetical protein